MKELFFSARLPDGREVCIAPITRDTFEANKAQDLGDERGYFIFEFDAVRPAAGIEILAKAASYDAAMRLVDIYIYAGRIQGALYHECEPARTGDVARKPRLRIVAPAGVRSAS